LERRVSNVSRGTDAERRNPRLVRDIQRTCRMRPTPRERRFPAPSTGPTPPTALRLMQARVALGAERLDRQSGTDAEGRKPRRSARGHAEPKPWNAEVPKKHSHIPL